jgi:oxygen-independent coproporphyrinogen-3 oxidase
MVMMGLRLSDGIARRAFHDELDSDPEALLPAEKLQRLAGEGYLEIDAAGLRATAAGRQRLDALLGYLLA